MKNKYLSNKRNSSFIHAKRGAKYRYNLYLNREKYETLNNLVMSGNGKVIQEQSRTRKVILLNYDNKDLKLVFDSGRKIIITFLPNIEEEKIKKVDRSEYIQLLNGEMLKI